LVVVQLTEVVDPSDALARLARQVPAGLTLRGAALLAADGKRTPREVSYELAIEPALTAAMAERATKLLSKDRVDVARANPKADAAKTLDIRQYLVSMSVSDGRLHWVQAIRQTGSVRPQEVLEALELPSHEHLHRLRRIRVEYGSE
jgi:hypothetical protein